MKNTLFGERWIGLFRSMIGHPAVNLNLGIPSHVAYLVVFLAFGTATSVGAQQPTIHFTEPATTPYVGQTTVYTAPVYSNITLGDHPFWYYASSARGRPTLTASDRTFKLRRWGLRQMASPKFLRHQQNVYRIRLSKRIRLMNELTLTNGAYLYHQPCRKWHP